MLHTFTSHPGTVRRWTARLMCGAAGAAVLVGGAYAQAPGSAPTPPPQDTSPDASTNGASPTGVSAVTITAEKRAENLQKVSLSAVVRTGTELKSENVTDLQTLQNQAPGLSIQPPVTSETYINIRGVGIQYTSPVSSNGVAFYVDGMYVPSLIDTVDSFYDLQNVEVLRGPQGTLVGSNADGGAIFVNSAQPSFDKFKGYIEQTVGMYSDYRTEGGINLPINDQFAARIAFVTETRNSFTKNIGPQSTATVAPTTPAAQNQPGDVDFQAVRLQLAWKPTDHFEYTFRYEPYQSRTDGFALKPDEAAVAPLANYFGLSTTGPQAENFYDPWAAANQNKAFTIDYQTPQFYDIYGDRLSGTGVWNITDAVELKSITSYQYGYETDQGDLLQGSAPGNTSLFAGNPPGPPGQPPLPLRAGADIYLTRKAAFNDITQEFDLLSTDKGPFQWVAGFYYLNTSGPLMLNFNNQQGGNPLSVLSLHTTYAGFASATYSFTDQLSLTAGARYSYDSQPYHELFLGPTAIATATDGEPTGNVKLNWQATPDTLLYVSYSTGYKAGGENLFITAPSGPGYLLAPNPYKPETNSVEELGLKTTVFDHHLRFDGDIYNSAYQQFQVQETLDAPIVGPVPFTQGVPNAAIWGVEGEFTGVFDALQFNLGFSYLNAKTSGVFGFVGPKGDAFNIPSGTTVPYAPEFSLNAGIQYDFHVLGGVLTPRIQYQYQSVQYDEINHDPNLQPVLPPVDPAYPNPLGLGSAIPAHGTWDFNLTYKAPENWTAQFYVTNFTNSTYIVNSLQSALSGAPPSYAYGAPLQAGARITYAF